MSQDETPSRWRVTQGERRVHTFAVLFSGCRHALKSARNRRVGYFYDCMFSMVGAAFAVEAYLNHLGQDRFGEKEWEEKMERGMNTDSKLRVLAKLLEYNLDFGRRPCQTFAEIFNYRNLIAHAGTESLTFEEGQVYDSTEGPTEPETKWEQRTTLETAERFYEDAWELVRQLHKAAGLSEPDLQFLDSSGWSSWTSTGVAEDE